MTFFKKTILPVLIIIVVVLCGLAYFVHEFAKGFGGNIGSITCVDDHQLKDEYLNTYIDSLYLYYPELQVPDSIVSKDANYKALDYEHLSLSKFYFSEAPIEIYYVQMNGTCMNIRFVYDPIKKQVSGVFRGDPKDKIKKRKIERIVKRFELEVMEKLEKLILENEPKELIYY